MTDDPLLRAVRGCPTVEVVWQQSGQLHVRSEPAVVDADQVVLLLTADAAGDAGSLAAARRALVAATDPRGAPAGWRPAAATAGTCVEPLGTAWADGPLLPALVRRDPVARQLVGSLLTRREHWGAVPRSVVRLRPVAPLEAPPARAAEEALVAALVRGEVRLLGVAGVAEGRDGVRLEPRAPLVPAPDGVPALAVRTAPPSVPGAARVEVRRGRLDGQRLLGVERRGRVDDAPGRLLARWRGERALARACRDALRDRDAPATQGGRR